MARERWSEAIELAEQAVERASGWRERSVCLNTAAQIAWRAGEFRRAERLASSALSQDNIDDDVAAELRTIIERARVELAHPRAALDGQAVLTYTMAGPDVGDGRCPPELIIERLGKLQALVMRTAERRLGLPFRAKGAPSRVATDLVAPSVRFDAGGAVIHVDLTPRQLNMLASASDVADDLVGAVETIARGDRDALERQIDDIDYRNNFIAVCAFLAPDGRRVTTSSLSWSSDRNTRRVVSMHAPIVVSSHAAERAADANGNDGVLHVFEGELRGVDETQKHRKIKLIRADSTTVSIEAEEAVLEDIVRPMYGRNVRVRARREHRGAKPVLVMVGIPEEI